MYSALPTSGREGSEKRRRIDSTANTFSVGSNFCAEFDAETGQRVPDRASHHPLAIGEGHP